MDDVQTTTTYRCPACGATLRFDAPSGKLQCDWCDSSFTVEEVERITAQRLAKADAKAKEAAANKQDADVAKGSAQEQGSQPTSAEVTPVTVASDAATPDATAPVTKEGQSAKPVDPIQEYLKRSNWEAEEKENLRSYVCETCAAELIVDKTTAVTRCPYCGNNTIIPGQLSGALRPKYVIPFTKTKEDAIAGLKDYYKGKRFLPKAFSKENHLEEVQGVYVPFWLYSTRAFGEATFTARRISTWTTGKDTFTKTDIYEAMRAGSMEFTRVPVDGSTKMPDAHMDAIEPYDYGALQPFSVAYLPGFLVERYDQDAEACQGRAEERMKESVRDELRETVTGYDDVDAGTGTATVDWHEVAYALMPVWMLHTRWSNEDFLFAYNGQTGKFIGDLPIDRKKVVFRFIQLTVPAFMVLMLCVVAGIFFGLL